MQFLEAAAGDSPFLARLLLKEAAFLSALLERRCKRRSRS